MKLQHQKLLGPLQKSGLSPKEALVYVSLLELGGAFPSKVSEYCGLKRATTYDILSALAVRGLVNEIEKRNKIFYQIEQPSRLINFSRGKVRLAQEGLEKAEKLLPELESMFSMLGDKPRVLFFEGDDTIENICEDILQSSAQSEMYAFSNAEKFMKLMPTKKLLAFARSKAKYGIATKAIFPDTPGNQAYGPKAFQYVKKSIIPVVRYVSAEQFPFEAEITIYGTKKVAITKLSGQNVIGVILEDKVIYNMMKMIFELAWQSALVKD